MKGLISVLDSFSTPGFRWMWLGSFTSYLSMSMQMTTRAWLVMQITTDSPMALAWTMVSFAFPLTFVSLIAGALADRMPRRTIVIVTQTGNMSLAILLGVLDMIGIVSFWHLILIGLASGSLMALNMPSRQAMISELVPENKLMNAISLNNAAMNITGMIGPAVAGFLIVFFGKFYESGTYGVFFVIGATYAFSAVSVAMVNVGRRPSVNSGNSVLTDISAGLVYAKEHLVLRKVVILVFMTVITGTAYWPLMPAWAREVLDVGADGLGILNSATGLGSLVGSLALASVLGAKNRGFLLQVTCVCWGVVIAIFAQTTAFGQAMPLLVLMGIFSAMFMSLNMTLLQTYSDPEMRGRVVGLGMMSWGLMPLGAIPFAWIASMFDTSVALTFSGVLLAISAIVFWVIYPDFRKIQ
ncbi:MAG: MFS transporter [Chloroflexota bacterium]|nr:MFS transporter [Chloroflexota bacterium]